ncbi:MAG TPA: hypothetical protein ENJ19_07185 [Gammaproteobacteria bacterium]|nr:hypothetical protein [Gammaproteobacteria bacterium]
MFVTMRYISAIGVLLQCLCLAAPLQASTEARPWIEIDTHKLTLAVVQNGKIKRLFHNISLGRGGFAPERRKGDGRTPLGQFRIAWVNKDSRYHLFFGLDYPNHEHAEYAFRHKLIDFDTYYAIRQALFRGAIPPQNTVLGGYIGIHGLGSGNRKVHQLANWTQGCIALTNEQVDELAHWVSVGTRVYIR